MSKTYLKKGVLYLDAILAVCQVNKTEQPAIQVVRSQTQAGTQATKTCITDSLKIIYS